MCFVLFVVKLLMLRELFVQNLALIEDVRVELRSGFCAWTGQTGAGKTLLLEALGLLLGERGSADLIRTGAEELRITGRFEFTRKEERAEVERLLDKPLDDDEILLSRRLTRAGRSYAYINDQPVAVGTLRQLGSALVDIHGQRESQSLLQPSYQLQVLDAYGHLEPLRNEYARLADELRDQRRRLSALSAERQQRQRELSLLRFEREELDAATLQPNEMANLNQERQRLAHAQTLQEYAAASTARLYDEEGSIVEQLGKLQRETAGHATHDSALNEIAERLAGLVSEVQDVAGTLRGMLDRYESDPARLDEVEKRLGLLRRLEKKYGRTSEELIAYRTTLDEQEERWQSQEQDLASLSDELSETFGRLKTAATELSKGRQRVAKKLIGETQKQLAELGMPEAKLDAALEAIPLGDDPSAADVPLMGADTLELTLAANKGEPARPLRKVASGGEMSRTMLALKTVLAAHDHLGTLIFDEIDANVGGRLGDILGQKLAALGQTHQVICVTHLPQVASYARNHWTIRKTQRGKRTVTTIELLDEPQRLEELASMLRGESRGETTRQEAAAMLKAARSMGHHEDKS